MIWILLSSQYVFALSSIELTTTTGTMTNQAPTFSTTTFTLTPLNTSFTIPVADGEYHYVGEYWDTSVTDENRSTVSLDHQLCDPVVVWSPTYDVDGTPQRTKRFRNLDTDSFEIQADQWLSWPFVWSTTIDWMVLEKWSHTLFDNTKIQAWSSSVSVVRANWACTNNYLWTIENFNPAFDATPWVLYAVTSDNDTRWTDAKVYNTSWWRTTEPSTSSMSITLEQSFNACAHDAETVDWIAFDETHLTKNWIIFDSIKSPDDVACCSATWYPLEYSSWFVAPPETIMVWQLWEDWGNGSFAVTHSNTATNAESYVSVDEDSSASRAHTSEPLGQIAISNNAWYFVNENILTHTLWWTDAGDFTLNNLTWSVASGVQLTLDTPPTCWNQTYTITVQSIDNHQCNPEASNVQTITINYLDTDADNNWVPDCEEICGDGDIDAGEECDDGDVENDDGCASDCTINDWFICDTWSPTLCEFLLDSDDRDSDTVIDPIITGLCEEAVSLNTWPIAYDEENFPHYISRLDDMTLSDVIYSSSWDIQPLLDYATFPNACSSPGNFPWWDSRPTNVTDKNAMRLTWFLNVPWTPWIPVEWTIWAHVNDWLRLTVWDNQLFEYSWNTESPGWNWKQYHRVTFPEPWVYPIEILWMTNWLCTIDPMEILRAPGHVSWYQDLDCYWLSQTHSCPGWATSLDFNLIGGDMLLPAASCQPCGNWVIDAWEECDDWNSLVHDGCDASCEIEYCRDDAPLNDTSKNFVITSLTPTVIAGTSNQPNSKVAFCFEDTTWSRDIFTTTTDSTWWFTYSPNIAPYAPSWINIWIMLHNESGLDIDHHALVIMK